MCSSSEPGRRAPGEPAKPGQHHFIRNERYDDSSGEWIAMVGTRLPDNKANRRKLAGDIDILLEHKMRVRMAKYEVKEETLGILYGEGAIPGLINK